MEDDRLHADAGATFLLLSVSPPHFVVYLVVMNQLHAHQQAQGGHPRSLSLSMPISLYRCLSIHLFLSPILAHPSVCISAFTCLSLPLSFFYLQGEKHYSVTTEQREKKLSSSSQVFGHMFLIIVI